jgi:hypothetical protein
VLQELTKTADKAYVFGMIGAEIGVEGVIKGSLSLSRMGERSADLG